MRLHMCVLLSTLCILEFCFYVEGATLQELKNSTNSTADVIHGIPRNENGNLTLKHSFNVSMVTNKTASVLKTSTNNTADVIHGQWSNEDGYRLLKQCFTNFNVTNETATVEKFISTDTDIKKLAVRILENLCLLNNSVTETIRTYLGNLKTNWHENHTNCSCPLTFVELELNRTFSSWEEDNSDKHPLSKCESSLKQSLLSMAKEPLKNFTKHVSETTYVEMLLKFEQTVSEIFLELAKLFHYVLDADMETMKYLMVVNVLPLRTENFNMIRRTMSLQWGIITSTYAVIDLKCHRGKESTSMKEECVTFSVEQAVSRTLKCSLAGISAPMSWEGDEGYFDSSCICQLTSSGSGSNCAVSPPEGMDRQHYCFVVLLEGFVKLVRRRVAVTYVDYTYKTKVSLKALERHLLYKHAETCKSQLSITGSSFKERILHYKRFACLFSASVNKPIQDCSGMEELSLRPFKLNTSCTALATLHMVLNGDDDTDSQYTMVNHENRVSTLSQCFTSVDILVRAVTLLMYISFSKLRNLPGKIFIGYQMTALTNIFVVKGVLLNGKALLPNSTTVAVDVYLDVSASFWLCSMSHFLFWCIKSLGCPDYLPLSTARMYLISYALFSWGVPACLCVVFFRLDQVPYLGMEWGQLGLLLTVLVVLFASVLFFALNFRVYRKIKNDVRAIRSGTTNFSHYQALFKFGVKTFIMSGAGIVVRLMLIQWNGSGEVINVFYMLSTFHGILIFIIYGLNAEARSLLWKTAARVLETSASQSPVVNIPMKIKR